MKIHAGQFKGRNLLPPTSGKTTRPITGMAKKSLFSILADSIDGATVVDLFSGTGTLGLEALSHGAERCFFAERDRSAIGRLERNIETIGVSERCTIWRGDCFRGLARRLSSIGHTVDVAFVDPPYNTARQWANDDELWRRAIDCVLSPLADSLSDGGIVVVRTGASGEIPSSAGPLTVTRVKRYGDMVMSFLGRSDAD